MTPVETLVAAQDMISRSEGAAVRVWPRAGALLARQALESALADFWRRHERTAQVAECPMATQLICLRTEVDSDLAHRTASTWVALSEVCHYHPYELSPTATELGGWLADVREVIEALDQV